MENEYSSIEDAKQSIVDEFGLFDGWVDRYEYIVELGRNLEGLPEDCHTEQYRVKGCQSQVWFRAREENGRLVTAGGRVLCVVARGDTIEEARAHAYENIARISFEGAHYRTDIGLTADQPLEVGAR